MQISQKLVWAGALSGMLLAGCGGGGSGGTTSAAAGSVSVSSDGVTGSRTITFMHFNDLHAHLTPHQDLASDGAGGTRLVERGGLARLATLVKQIRAENPDSVLMNVGDTYHGGVEALYTLGNAIVAPVNALGIDVGVPGNWDFGFSSTIFRLRYTDLPTPKILGFFDELRPEFTEVFKPNFPNLAANLTLKLSGEHVLPPTMLKEVGGVTVGFVGITSDIVHHVYPLLAPLFHFTGDNLDAAAAEVAYRDLINQHAADLRAQGAHVVVVMSELGIHKDHRLAQIIQPGAVDVFFSAHTHEATFEPLTSDSGALVVEAGNDGYLGRMDVTLQDGQVVGRQWELLTIDNTLADDPEVKALVDRARAPFLAIDLHFTNPMPNTVLALVEPIDKVIGHTDQPLDRRNALESSFNNGLTDILRHYGETDIALGPGFRFDGVIAPGALLEDNTVASGDITLEDVYRFFPLIFTVATGEVSGARLHEILEEILTTVYSPDVFRHKGGWFQGLSGIGMNVNLANPDGSRIVDLWLTESSQPITDDTILTVTGCKRPVEPRDMLCRYPGFQNVKPLIGTGIAEPWTIIDFLIEAIQTGVAFDAARRDLVDLNQTPVWPDTPFIQPLGGVQ